MRSLDFDLDLDLGLLKGLGSHSGIYILENAPPPSRGGGISETAIWREDTYMRKRGRINRGEMLKKQEQKERYK
jgi:hypothetical protein